MTDFAAMRIPQFGGSMIGAPQLSGLQQSLGPVWDTPLAGMGTLGDLLSHLFGAAPAAATAPLGAAPTSDISTPLPDVSLPQLQGDRARPTLATPQMPAGRYPDLAGVIGYQGSP